MTAKRLTPWILGLLAVLLAAGAYAAQASLPLLRLGVGYGARVACACRHIGNRPLAQCRDDFEAGMEAIRLTEDPAKRTVTASVPMLVSRTVRFDPELGCQPEPYKGPIVDVPDDG
jgi:hypothetical protein